MTISIETVTSQSRDSNCFSQDWIRARVILGDASSYSACTIREPQPPASWSNDTIAFTVNAGKLTTGQAAYLFMIDAEGNVSGGHEVVIGGGRCGQQFDRRRKQQWLFY